MEIIYTVTIHMLPYLEEVILIQQSIFTIVAKSVKVVLLIMDIHLINHISLVKYKTNHNNLVLIEICIPAL